MGFFETLFDAFNEMVNEAVAPVQYYMIFKVIIGTWVTIRVGYIAIQTTLGYEKRAVERVLLECLKLLIIMLMAMNYNGYLDACFSALDSFKSWVSGNVNIYAQLDKTFLIGQDLAAVIYDQGDMISGPLGAMLVTAGVTVVCATPLLLLFVASITLKILSLTAPIFIGCLMFGIFKNFFTQWLNLVLANALIYLFLGLVLGIAIGFFQDQLTALLENVNAERPSIWGSIGILMIICFATFIMCKMAVELAKSITQVCIEGVGTTAAVGAGLAVLGFVKTAVELATGASVGNDDSDDAKNPSSGREFDSGDGQSAADKRAQDAFNNSASVEPWK